MSLENWRRPFRTTGKSGDGKGKYILVRALRDRLPEALFNRRKMGFGVPLSLWFRGALRAFLWDHLSSAAFAGRGIVSPDICPADAPRTRFRRRDNSHWLWSLLMLETVVPPIGRAACGGDALL